MGFGDEIRQANSPSTTPSGIGGDANTIWHCDDTTDVIYELSTIDFSGIRSADSPSNYPTGIGGDSSKIWHCDYGTADIYELSTTDLSVIRQDNSPSAAPRGIGGDANTIWHCDDTVTAAIYELSTTDFSVIRQANSPSDRPSGIGGDANVIWHCDRTADDIYELSTTDFSVIKQADSPSTFPRGIGGDANTIWHCDHAINVIYELDAARPPNEAPTAPTSLQVDGKSTPTGANCVTSTPQFTAIFNDPDAGDQSNAIEIQVGSASDLSDKWDSGWLADSTAEGNRCSVKTYAGAALSQGTSYWWRCRFRDDDDEEGDWSDWQQFDVCAAEPEPEVGLLECAPGGPLPKRCPFRVR